jgi:hypothetical protein
MVDEFLESYVSWREACEDVESAYSRWKESRAQQRDYEFATYQAALDREEHAAGIHSLMAERLRTVAEPSLEAA